MASDLASATQFVLKATCPARSGVVAGVTTYLSDNGCYLSELAQYDDPSTGRFFMRALGRLDDPRVSLPSLRDQLAPIAEQFDMQWQLNEATRPMRVLLMVSKFDHCLTDLLYRRRKGELNMDVTAIVSNHPDAKAIADREGLRFVHLPVNKENKPQQEAALMQVVEETDTELVVLARYMQILSNDLCQKLAGRAINIHHSFLPGFKGAKPYHQAHERGVKVIGATAHYVTSDLDEGPIIEQAVQLVDHTFTPKAMVAIGRDTETLALAKAVKLHIEKRVFVDGNKTVVFK